MSGKLRSLTETTRAPWNSAQVRHFSSVEVGVLAQVLARGQLLAAVFTLVPGRFAVERPAVASQILFAVVGAVTGWVGTGESVRQVCHFFMAFGS